jgi:hypothetical protein
MRRGPISAPDGRRAFLDNCSETLLLRTRHYRPRSESVLPARIEANFKVSHQFGVG